MKDKSLYVYIVDDEQKVRDSLSKFLRLYGFKVKAYADAESYLYELDQDEIGCLISDIDMKDMDGLQLQRRLNEIKCIRPTIFITGHANVDIAVRAMKLGAVDFIEKPFDPDELAAKVGAAIDLFAERITILGCYRLLTKKEIEVFKHVAKGGKNRDIAEKLFISIPTVEAHRSRVMKKMQAGSLSELVKMSVLLTNNPI
ncbi:response regulator [Candidatus Thioglobus sp.]|uniref:response regulator transcription factor n=1 Tax=Candidatus Thioglobus sp. TaxID=2026721 RepID=UPI002610410D|nr:response regulator [Candidatus Thioglobus sp.]MDG2395511.1 response regulator [Candidatus Thioglobus sp.]